MSPNAAPAAIGSGDAFIERLTSGGTETEVPGVLNFIFKTNPGLTEYSVDGGASGTVGTGVLRFKNRIAKQVCVIADSVASAGFPAAAASAQLPSGFWLLSRCSAPSRYQA